MKELLESKFALKVLGNVLVNSKINHHVPTPVLIGKIAIIKPNILLNI
jgi:hypothetical protein